MTAALPLITRVDGGWNLTWDTDSEVLDVDMLDNGKVSWFWRSRLNDQADGSNSDEDGFSDAFHRRANWFQQALIAKVRER